MTRLKDSRFPASPTDTPDASRRGALLIGAGALIAPSVMSGSALAQTVAPGAKAAEAAPAASGAAPAAGVLTMKEVYTKAREQLFPRCRVCPQCDGVACAGEFPGFGGIGTGGAFRNNYQALHRTRLTMRTVHGVSDQDHKPDTSTVIFGRKLSFPAMAAPIGGIKNSFGDKLSEPDYFDAIIGGCIDAGTVGAIGDSPSQPMAMMQARIAAIGRHGGGGIAGIKPRPNANFIELVRYAEQANAYMITIDTDSAGRYRGAPREVMVEPKTVAQLRELVRSTKIPLVVKGIMTTEEARLALEAGAAGIVVSNHGGRVLDDTPGVAEVLPAIAAKFKGKMVIFADGCVRYGDDVLKYMALGADAVLVGRHIARGAYGGGRAGVALMMNQMRNEFQAAMVMTGSGKVRDIYRRVLAA